VADRPADRRLCNEPADANGFFRCQKDAEHGGERYHTKVPGGDYWWGYVPTAAELNTELID
jgi:hypothetical protein